MRRKVLLHGPVLSRSGYGVHARFILRALRQYEHLFEIHIVNTNWGRTGQIIGNDLERKWIDGLIKDTFHYVNNGGQFDMCIQCTIPGEWKRMAPVMIGATAGTETTKISPEWMQKCMEVDRIITVSKHASYAFEYTTYKIKDEQGGDRGVARVNVPIEHVNYPVRPELIQKDDSRESKFQFDSDFNFLLMAQWGPRKNIENTIKWWIEEFHDQSDVGLVVKTSIANDSRVDRDYTQQRLENLLSEYSDRKCKVYLLHGTLNDQELCDLYTHPTMKAFLSMSHGEGFGLPAFESAMNDLPVITTEWGGELDFVTKYEDGAVKNLFVSVDYDIAPIQKEAVWPGVLQADSLWAFPKAGSFKMKLRHVRNNYDKVKEDAVELGQYVREAFKAEKQYEKFVQALGVIPKKVKNEDVVEFD